MKKFLVLILAIIMVVSVVACKNEPEQSGSALPVEEEAGKDALIEQGAGAKALDHTGFKVGVTVNGTGEEGISVEIGGRNGVYWLTSEDTTLYFAEKDNNTYMYFTGFWIKVADKSLKDEVFTELVDSLLYNAYDLKDQLVAAGTETKHGRTCSKYTVSASEGGKNYSFTMWVDQEFGITMGVEAAAGSEYVAYTINPKLSGMTDGDTPSGYAEAKACTNFFDQLPM